MNNGNIETPKIGTVTDVSNLLGRPHIVILFNDDVHGFEEVVIQVQRSVKCDLSTAYSITMEAHQKGKAVAFSGNLETCELIDMRLSSPPLSLRTEIQPS